MLRNKKVFFFILVFFIPAASGCDMINSVKEYFLKSSNKPAVVEAPQPAMDAASTENLNKQESAVAQGPLPEDVVVRIGAWSVTIDQFNNRLRAIKEVVPDFNVDDPKSKDLVLEELIRQQLLMMQAEEEELDKKQDVQDAVEEFRRTVLVREIASRLTEKVDVTEEETKAFYEENKTTLVEPPQILVREIKTDTEEKAKAILVEILQGADFAQTAKQKSMAPSASSGGDLGILKELPFPEMLAPLQTLNQGETSSVIKGQDGFYIIKIEEKKEGQPIAYEQIKNDILQNRKLFKQQQAVLDYIAQLEKKFKIETNKELLNKGK